MNIFGLFEKRVADALDRLAAGEPVGVLVVSQFTLYGDARKGRRPSWVAAAPPAVAKPLVDRFAAALRDLGLPVATGRFGADVLSVDELQWLSPKVDQTYANSANGVGKSDHTTATRYVSEGFGTYDAYTSDRQRLSVVGGASMELSNSDLNFIRGEGFTSGFTKARTWTVPSG